MNNEEQRIALCEWMGWKREPETIWSAIVNPYQSPDGSYHSNLPDTNSLDVLHEMEMKLDESQQDSYWCHLRHLVDCGLDEMQHCFNTVSAKADKRREALCRTLWPERFRACADPANPAP